jgi:hypothetical protein
VHAGYLEVDSRLRGCGIDRVVGGHLR